MGFRPQRGCDDALMIFETIISKSLEWNAPVWIVSIDLTKAFDKVEYNTLFAALAEQGVGDAYIALLTRLYSQQSGSIDGANFPIRRGVRQSDILSPLLFNAALENVMRHFP